MTATVIVEHEQGEPERSRVAAIVAGAQFGIEHAIILKHLRDAELPARVQLHAGDMDVVIGAPSDVEVLPGDLMQVSGSLRNVYFGARPSLEVSLFLLRLVCTNGAYALRQVAGGRLASWSTIRQARAFLDQQLGRIASFHGGALQGAVQRMSDDLVEPEEHQRVELLLSRLAGAERARNLMSDAVSSYDVLNAITAAANQVAERARQRQLQVLGGEYLERYLAP